MKLKILIVEDKILEYQYTLEACEQIAHEVGLEVDEGSFFHAQTVDELESMLFKKDFDFDILILDIGLGGEDLPVEKIQYYLANDILIESKTIILTGNEGFWEDGKRVLTAVANGVRSIAKKGNQTGIFSFEKQLTILMNEIKNESVWANIGRFSPNWKRKIFRDNDLWKELKTGKRCHKAILLADISNSTHFVISQRKASIADAHILELFKSFANDTTEILEKDEYKGIVERYSGDEVLSYFHMADLNDNEGACCAIRAAIEIAEKFRKRYIELKKEYNYQNVMYGQHIVTPSLRILIGCGEVMWTLQGADSRPQLSIMTDQVAKCYRSFTHRDQNYRRRITPNNIFITHDVYRLVKGNFKEFNAPLDFDLRDFGNFNIYQLNHK